MILAVFFLFNKLQLITTLNICKTEYKYFIIQFYTKRTYNYNKMKCFRIKSLLYAIKIQKAFGTFTLCLYFIVHFCTTRSKIWLLQWRTFATLWICGQRKSTRIYFRLCHSHSQFTPTNAEGTKDYAYALCLHQRH